MLKQKLQEELRQAMLARDVLKTSVLRMLLSAINYYEIQKGGAGYEANDEDVLTVTQKEVKQRKDSIEQFQKGRRQDLVDKETKELKILQTYLPRTDLVRGLPQQLSEEALISLITQTIKQLGATSMTDIGKVMSVLMPKLKGKADGSLLSKIVREKLR